MAQGKKRKVEKTAAAKLHAAILAFTLELKMEPSHLIAAPLGR